MSLVKTIMKIKKKNQSFYQKYKDKFMKYLKKKNK